MMGHLIQSCEQEMERLQPTELILVPHYLLASLPLHIIPWQGKPLIEHFPVAYLPTPTFAPAILQRRKTHVVRALIVGNPMQNLTSADVEMQAVDRCLSQRGIAVEVLHGPSATAARVLEKAPTASILHFACHTQLDSENFPRSGMDLADQRLTVQDMMALLDLQQTALVFLSSCDGARRKPVRMDELLAVARAFLYAGAPSAAQISGP